MGDHLGGRANQIARTHIAIHHPTLRSIRIRRPCVTAATLVLLVRWTVRVER
jgi:hypothetical protein